MFHTRHPIRRAPQLASIALISTLLALPVSAQIYRCGNTYSDVPCPGAQAVELPEPALRLHVSAPATPAMPPSSSQPSPAPGNHPGKARQQARDWKQTERELHQAAVRQPPERSSTPSGCQSAERRIQKIDELARKGGKPATMDRLREERQRLRDWQFNAGC